MGGGVQAGLQKKGRTFGAKFGRVIGDVTEAQKECDDLQMMKTGIQNVADTDATQQQTLRAKNCGRTRHKPLETQTSTALR